MSYTRMNEDYYSGSDGFVKLFFHLFPL